MSAALARYAFIALVTCACAAPPIPEGKLGCGASSDCPEGWACRADGLCWSSADAPDGAVMHTPIDGGDEVDGRVALDARIVEDSGAKSDAGQDAAPAPAPECDGDEGEPCDDGLFCTVDDTCVGGTCIGAAARGCGDGVECNGVESCDETADACVAGEVTCTAPLLCDVASDRCVTSCADCTIDGSCIGDGSVSTLNPCVICDVERARDAWSDDDGASCGDDTDSACSAADTCALGVCEPNHAGNGVTCGESATTCSAQDTCDGNGSCVPNHFDGSVACGGPAITCTQARYCLGNGSCSSVAYSGSSTACDADDDLRTIDHCSGFSDECVIGPDYCATGRCWRVPPTGQTRCYNGTVEMACPGTPGSASCGTTEYCGQDAQLADSTRAYTCKAAGGVNKSCSAAIVDGDMVEDSLSLLTWQRVLPSSYDAPCDGGAGCTRADAIAYCEQLSYGGFSDWRLPDVRELLSIASYNPPATPGPDFPGSIGVWYWSVNLYEDGTQYGLFVALNGASSGSVQLGDEVPVRCVRSGPRGPIEDPNRWYMMGSEPERTIFDRATGLEWRALLEEYTTWRQALTFCESLEYAGHSDWRLPDQNQIFSIIDLDANYPASSFPNPTTWNYWSSTTYVGAPINAYMVNGGSGDHTWLEKTWDRGVALCVRLP